MKMDIECIRNILLQVEENKFTLCRQHYKDVISDEKETLQFVKEYDYEKLFYHINLAEELGFIKCIHCAGFSTVLDLTAQGHLFLADIREEKVWSKTKEISNQLGTYSLEGIKQIAINVASSLIANYFQKWYVC